MRLLFLSTWFPCPPDNGSKLRAYYLLQALAQKHQVTLVAFSQTAGAETYAHTRMLPEGITVCPVPEDPFRYVRAPQLVKYAAPIPLACWPSRAMNREVLSLTRSQKWDAVVAIQEPVAQYALLARNAPAVLDIDVSTSYRPYLERTEAKGPARRAKICASWKKAHFYEAWLFKHFEAGTAALPAEVAFLHTRFATSGCRFALLPNGVDCALNRSGLAAIRPHTLVYNGALTYSANYEAMQWFLAEIYPRIKTQQPDTSLTITGSTKGVDLDGLALDDSVYLTGYVEDVRLPVAQSMVCIAPIRQGGGTRLKILEAMALGTPVVATRKGAEGLEVIDGEHLLMADAPDLFAQSVLRLLGDRDLRSRLAANARRLVEDRYDWTTIGKRFADLIEDAVTLGRRELK